MLELEKPFRASLLARRNLSMKLSWRRALRQVDW